MPTYSPEQAAARKRLRTAAARLERSLFDRDAAVLAARSTGLSLAEIGERVGLTKQGVSDIVRRREAAEAEVSA